MNIEKVNLPGNSLISRSFGKIDYNDAYMIECRFNRELPVEDVVKTFFSTFSGWVNRLMHVRNILVKPFGLKSDESTIVKNDYKNFRGVKGETIDFFQVFDRTTDEVMLGADDKHLDARLSFILKKNNDKYSIILTTTVHYNNMLGRIYFIPVKPFHKIIIKSCLKKTVERLKTSETTSQRML